jgi:kynurenine formamidase
MRQVFPFLIAAVLAAQQPFTEADFHQAMKDLSNWGRWGKDDELGALNLITPAKRRGAARLVREGVVVSLSHDAEKEKAVDNPRPFLHEMINTSRTPNASSHSDFFTIAHHGLAHTHLDALCHFFYRDRMYNGISRQEVTEKGAGRLSVHRMKNGIFTRGVLMDIPRLKGVPHLDPGTPIYPADLDAWEKKAGLRAGPGDVVLIRTGRWALRAAQGPWPPSELAGLHASCARWLKQRDAAVLGSDAASDVRLSRVEGVAQPIHILVLVALGMPILDNVDLEALAEACARRRRWDFLLTTAPWPSPARRVPPSTRLRSSKRESGRRAYHSHRSIRLDFRADFGYSIKVSGRAVRKRSAASPITNSHFSRRRPLCPPLSVYRSRPRRANLQPPRRIPSGRRSKNNRLRNWPTGISCPAGASTVGRWKTG